MPAVASSLLLALGQLADGRVIRILLKSLAVTLVLFALVAWGGWYGLDALLDWLGLDEGLVAGGGTLRQLASLVLTLLGLWLAWRIVAMAVINFFADEVVVAVEARHYPQAAALLFWLVNAALVGRELQDMVWLRHRRDANDPAPVGRGERFLLGGAVAALLAVPLVNLLAPILGAAAATHLIHRPRARKGDRA